MSERHELPTLSKPFCLDKGHREWAKKTGEVCTCHKFIRPDLAAERERKLREALREAVKAAEYVIQITEADVKAGEDPSPYVKSMPSATLAHAYMAMGFVDGARNLLAELEDEDER